MKKFIILIIAVSLISLFSIKITLGTGEGISMYPISGPIGTTFHITGSGYESYTSNKSIGWYQVYLTRGGDFVIGKNYTSVMEVGGDASGNIDFYLIVQSWMNPQIGLNSITIGKDTTNVKAGIGFTITESNQTNNCTDSDDGKSYFVKGTVTQGTVSSTDCCSVNQYNLDCYATSGYLAERFCNAQGSLDTEVVSCPNLCQNGACLSSPPTCTDSDEGKNYYSKGQTTISTGANLIDHCPTNSPYKAGITLLEAYCTNESPFVVYEEYACPNGCSNGACLQGTTCNNVVTNGDFEIGTLNGWYSNHQNIKIVNKNSYPQYVFSGNYSVDVTDGTFQQQGIPLNGCGGYPKTLNFAVFLKENTVAAVSLIVYPSSEIGTVGNPILYMIYDPDTYKCSDEGNTICIPEYVTEKWYYIERDVQSDLTKVGHNSGLYHSAYISLGTLGSFTLNNTAYYDNVALSVGKKIDTTCASTSDCIWCGSECAKRQDSMVCPAVVPPTGYSCTCDAGKCTKKSIEKVCSNHAQCSQACDNLGIDFHWMGTGSSYRSWNGICPSTVYGCMTGQCCIGQCRYTTTNDCTCVRTNKVDIYGDVCPIGQTCGSDCYCHSTSGDEYKTVNLKETFYLSASSFSPYKWEIKSYDKNYLENKISGVGCGSNGECTYTFQFTALKEGKTLVELNKINTNDNSVVEAKRFYVTIIGGTDTIQIVYLNKPFNMNEGGKAEVVDYRNMRIKLNKIVIATPTTGGGSSSSITGGIIISPSGGGGSTAYISDKFAVIEVSLAEYSSSTGVTSLLTLYEGETKSIFGAYIKLQKIDLTTRTATFLVTLQTADFNFKTNVDKGAYTRGETVKIVATLSGSSDFNFGNTKVEIKLKDPKGNVIDLPVKSTGVIASECSISTTTNAYTCPILNQYSYYAYYTIPSDAILGYYSISSKATLESIEKYAYNNFNVDNVYSELVGVEINPKKISTVIGETANYKVTITDKHPLMRCTVPVATSSSTTAAVLTQITNQTTTEPITKCGTQIYNYLINVDGLPYHSVYPNVVSVQAGESKTFELKVFPSPTKTAQGITTAIRKTEPTTTEERTVSISGKPIATETKTVVIETNPINEAVFKFAVKASLREEPSVSNSDTGFLHVKFIQDPEPPPFPEEKIDIELKKGWNLVSVPGKGAGFIQGSCSAESKPVAFVYLIDQRKYVSLDKALEIMGREKLLEHISTRSFWIYSPEECKIGFKFETYSTYSGLEINKGWNLIGITKDMVGETLSAIKGTCNFEKIYFWDASSQKWIERSESDLIEKMGYGMLIKSNSTCILKTNIIQPPSFPEE